MKVYPCPICGQSKNRHGEPMDTPQKTAGHIDGARDAQHENESGQENMQAIRENETEMDGEELEESVESGAQRREAVPEMTVRSTLTGQEHTLGEFLDVVDAHLDADMDNEERMRENIEDIEDDLEELRERVGQMEQTMNRVLGYVQVIAEDRGLDGIQEDMRRQGFTGPSP